MYFLSGSSRLQSFELSNQAGTRFDRGILTKHSKHQRWMLDGVGCGRDAGWSLIKSPVKRLRCLWHGFALHTPKHLLSPTTARRTTSLNLDLVLCGRFLATPYIGPLLIVRPWAEVISRWFKGTGDWWGLCCDHFLSLNPHFPWLDHHFLWLNATLNQH